jgi:hypothetical protein
MTKPLFSGGGDGNIGGQRALGILLQISDQNIHNRLGEYVPFSSLDYKFLPLQLEFQRIQFKTNIFSPIPRFSAESVLSPIAHDIHVKCTPGVMSHTYFELNNITNYQ